MAGEPLNLSAIQVPTYAMGAREDHIVPWTSAYRSLQVLGGPKRFVLGASGHIAGSINPASKNKRSYWVNDQLGNSAEDWFAKAKEMPGSWWNDWIQWVAAQGGEQVLPTDKAGSRQNPVIEPAPGSYVKVRAVSS